MVIQHHRRQRLKRLILLYSSWTHLNNKIKDAVRVPSPGLFIITTCIFRNAATVSDETSSVKKKEGENVARKSQVLLCLLDFEYRR